MSKEMNHGTRDFSKYDILETAELEQILREDCDAPEDAESDTELLLYVMGVLAKRRKENNPAERTSAAAWESFKQNYYPEQELKAVAKEKSKRTFAPWLRRAVAAAAALVLVVSIPITAHALNWEELWDIFARWTKETFSFVSGEDVQVTDPYKTNKEDFTSLQDALLRSNRDPDVVPTWIPEGFVLQDIEKMITPFRESYCAMYTNGEKNIAIKVHNYIAEDPQKIEIGSNLIEVYAKSGKEYYIFLNVDQLQVIWLDGTYECIISGDLTLEEGKQMIDSIRKG